MKFFRSLSLKNLRNHLSWKLSWRPSQNVFLNDAWTPLFQRTLLATKRFTIVHCRLWNMDHPSLITIHWSNLNWNGCIHEISAVLMGIVITLQSQFASLAQKSARKYSASSHECRWMFTENKADETFHVTYTYLYSMAGRRDIDRSYKCVSEWRFFLVKSCICSFILSCFCSIVNVII